MIRFTSITNKLRECACNYVILIKLYFSINFIDLKYEKKLLTDSCPKIFVPLSTPYYFTVHIRDASGSSISLQDFSVHFKDANVLPPQQTLGVRMLT